MNKLLLSLLALFLVFNTSAQNKLSVFSEDGHQFYLILNGIRQNVNPETNVRVDGLTADYFTGKVIFTDESLGEIEKKYLMVTGAECKPCDVTYKIKTDKNGSLVMKPFSFSTLATAPPPPPNVTVVQYNTAPMPPPILGVQITETTTTTNRGTGDNVNVGVNMGGFNMGVNVNVNDGYSSSSQTTTTTTTTITQPQPVIVEEVGCVAMSPSSFTALKGSIDKKSFDDDKLAVAKQGTAANCLTVAQIKNVMGSFGWEDTKLNYAKFAYAYCVDQQNYFQVNDAFEWDDSTEELNNFIGR